MIEAFYWLNAGYCTTPGKATYPGYTWRRRPYFAWFAALRHSRLGWILFDTSYSGHYIEQSRHFPASVLNRLVPVTLTSEPELVLRNIGCEPKDVAHVIVSHLHADHIGGLRCFTNATIHMHSAAIEQARKDSGFKALQHGFLPGLLPQDWQERTIAFNFNASGAEVFPNHKVFETTQLSDVFEDGSVHGLYLPGHSPGMTGIMFQCLGQSYFLCADAIYHIEGAAERRMGFAQKFIGGNAAEVQIGFNMVCDIYTACKGWHIMASHCSSSADKYHRSSNNGGQ